MENPTYKLSLSKQELDILYTTLNVIDFDKIYDRKDDFDVDLKTVMTTLFELSVRMDDARNLVS